MFELLAGMRHRATVADRMGMYDVVHTGHRCGQVKVWTNALEELVIGDQVSAVRGRFAEQRGIRADSTYTVSMHGDGWLHIEGGVLVAWADEPGRGPRMRGDGMSPAAAPDNTPANGYWRVASGECDVCDQLRAGIAPRAPRSWRTAGSTVNGDR